MLNDSTSRIFPRLHNSLFVLVVIGILAYSGSFAFLMLTKFDLINIIRDVNNDDSFYYFKTAQYLAKGFFSTFDGGITRTNGYHPIWLLFITPVYWVFDSESALFAIKALEIMLCAGGAALIVFAARLSLPAPCYVLLFALVPGLYQAGGGLGRLGLLGGMEAAASLFWLGLLFLACSLFEKNPSRWTWFPTAVVFTLPWVRLEFAAISLTLTAALCFVKWSDHSTLPTSSWRSHLTMLIGAWSGILLNLVYNRMVFGGFVPISGMVKSKIFSADAWNNEGGYDLLRNFQEIFQIPIMRDGIVRGLSICGITISLWLVATLADRQGAWRYANPKVPVFMVCAFGCALGHLAKFVQSALTMHPSESKYPWYFVPAYLMEALTVPLICLAAILVIRPFAIRKSLRTASLSTLGIVVVGVALLAWKTDFSHPFDYVDHRVQNTTFENAHMGSYLAVHVLNRILPEDSVVGSADAGVVGYFSASPVVNLDGLMNSYEYFRVLNPGIDFRKAGSKIGLTHWANASGNRRQGQDMLYEAFLEIAPFGSWRDPSFYIFAENPPDLTFDFYNRMKPSFDWESNGIAAIVTDRRLVQVFIQDCRPAHVPDLFVFSWNLDGLSRTEVRRSFPLRRTHLGYCSRPFILPMSAVPPIGMEVTTVEEFVRDVRPRIRSDFDVYLKGEKLFYIKAPCTRADMDLPVFLSVVPVDSKHLPDHRKQYNWDNLSFRFVEHGWETRGSCVAIRNLPHYAIATIHTGQHMAGGGMVWEGHFALADLQ